MITAFTATKTLINFLSFTRLSYSFCGRMIDEASPSASLHYEYIKKIKKFIPELSSSLHKGQCGRIGIIGGSLEYTGAPYFTAISALKTGADLAYIFCCEAAAPVIKSYSPELIVTPLLDSDDVVNNIEPWLQKIHALVIGPGLGRDPATLKNIEKIINHCKTRGQPCLPLVLDADGLFLLNQNIGLIQDYKGPVVITPNVVEFDRLKVSLASADMYTTALALNAVIVRKGMNDIIINGIQNKVLGLNSNYITIQCDTEGCPRRCGGQGDILAGCIATFVAWFRLHRAVNFASDFTDTLEDYEDKLSIFHEKFLGYSLAAYAACMITRTCSRLAYEEHERSMTSSDMIKYIHQAFKLYFKHLNVKV